MLIGLLEKHTSEECAFRLDGKRYWVERDEDNRFRLVSRESQGKTVATEVWGPPVYVESYELACGTVEAGEMAWGGLNGKNPPEWRIVAFETRFAEEVKASPKAQAAIAELRFQNEATPLERE